jgi:hypothetical protein
MPNPDILLEQDRISVVGGNGPEETGGTERGDLEITTAEGDPATIRLNADRANLTLGGGSGGAPEGDLRLRDANENLRIQVTAQTGNRNAPTEDRVWIDGGKGQIALGDGENDFVHLDGENAEVEVRDFTGDAQARLNNIGLMLSQFTGSDRVVTSPLIDPETRETIRLFGDQARAAIGNNFVSGTLNLYRSGPTDSSDGFFHETVAIDGEEARATLGGSDRSGQVTLTDRNDNDRVTLDAGTGELRLYGTPPGSGTDAPEITLEAGQNRAKAYIGGFDRSGQIWLAKQSSGNQLSIPIDLDAEHARVTVGGDGTDGVLKATDSGGSTTAEIQAADGNLVAGGDGTEGTMLIRHTDGSGNSVNYRLTATQQGLVFSTMKSSSGNNPTLNQQEALRIDPDGTVRVKGGSVQSL